MQKIFLVLLIILLFCGVLHAENAFLEEEAHSYNKELPKSISDDVALEKLEYKSKLGFTYYYTISGIESDDDIKLVSAKLLSHEDETLQDTCENTPDFFIQALVLDNTPIIYNYKTTGGKLICDIVLNLNRCSDFEDEDDR